VECGLCDDLYDNLGWSESKQLFRIVHHYCSSLVVVVLSFYSISVVQPCSAIRQVSYFDTPTKSLVSLYNYYFTFDSILKYNIGPGVASQTTGTLFLEQSQNSHTHLCFLNPM